MQGIVGCKLVQLEAEGAVGKLGIGPGSSPGVRRAPCGVVGVGSDGENISLFVSEDVDGDGNILGNFFLSVGGRNQRGEENREEEKDGKKFL